MNRRLYLFSAVMILLLTCLHELGRIVLNEPWWNITSPAPSHTVSSVLSVLWLSTALFLLLRRRRDSFYTLSWIAGAASVLAMAMHGMVTRIFGHPLSLLHVPLAVLLGFCIKRSFDPTEFRAYRERMTRRARHASSLRGRQSS